MNKEHLFRYVTYLILFIFIANFLANRFHFYYSIWWFDILMHFLGGAWLGLVFVWFWSKRELSLYFDSLLLFKVVLWILFIGIAWEVFEFYFINYVAQNSFDLADTLSDILLDLSGGILIALYFSRKYAINRTNKVELE